MAARAACVALALVLVPLLLDAAAPPAEYGYMRVLRRTSAALTRCGCREFTAFVEVASQGKASARPGCVRLTSSLAADPVGPNASDPNATAQAEPTPAPEKPRVIKGRIRLNNV